MNPGLWVVFAKEVQENFRDRRSVSSAYCSKERRAWSSSCGAPAEATLVRKTSKLNAAGELPRLRRRVLLVDTLTVGCS